ncbi:uncharacterized protein LOC130444214 [Diorhabda sublineata]|uniref:uncharacterized protein LOC130444214 n=1 Tax=Diorhabda sublineata TaxID=1163346 RepID=UPI0024E078BF|nr:uncharacterized protein LOC130444214 [Diorhabda sublineata]
MKLSIPDHYMTLYCTPSRVLHIWEIPIRSKPLPYPLIDLEPLVFEEASSSDYETSKKSHIPVSRTISDGNELPVTNLQEIPDTCIPRPNYDDDDPSIARPRPLNWKPRKCYMISDEDELSDAYNEEDLPEEKPTQGKTNPLKAKFEKLKKFGKSILIAVATKLRKPDNEDSSESEDISIEYYFTDEIVQASNDLMEIRPISPSTCTRPSTLTEWLLTRKTIKENKRKEALKRQSIVEFTVEPIPSTPGPSSIPIGTQSSTKSKSSTKITGAIKKMIISPSTATTSSKSTPGSSTASKSTGAISRVTRSSKLTGGDTCKLIGTKPTISKLTISAIPKTTGSPIRKPARKSVEPGICEMPDLLTTRNYDDTTHRLITRKKTLEKTTTVDKKGEKDKKKSKRKDKDQ